MKRKSTKEAAKTAVKKAAVKKSTSQSSEEQKDQKPKWKKTTRGTLYPFPTQRNRRVKPFETISATEQEIAKYRDQFELVADGTGIYKTAEDKPKVKKPAKPEITEKDTYTLEPLEGGGFNVVSSAGKVMNDTPLSEEEATALKASFEEEVPED